MLSNKGFPTLIYKNLVEVVDAEFTQSDFSESPLKKINLNGLQDEITWIKYEHLINLIKRIDLIDDPRANIPWVVSQLSAQCFGVLGFLLVSSSNTEDWKALYTQYASSFGWHLDSIVNKGNTLLFTTDSTNTYEHEFNQQITLLLTCLCLRIWHISAPYGLNSMKVEINNKILPETSQTFPSLQWIYSTQKHTAIHFPDETKNKSLIGSNERLRGLFLKEANLQLKMYGNQADLVAKVREILRQNTNLQDVSLASVAHCLHMSERTLNRQLIEQNTTYKEIFSNFRSKLSLELLFVGQSIEKVALRLGFSERSTFERAFKKWQGFTPAQMQASYSLLSREKRVSDIVHPDNIPNLPLTATRLLGILNNDNSNFDELIEIVSQDPGLVAKVMQIAGSALYANNHVDSLKQAILGVFGTEKLKSLALMLLSSRLFSIESDTFDLDRFWLQSLATAQISEDIGKTGIWGKQIGSNLYFVGLFYDLGSLFIAHCLPQQSRQIKNEMQSDFSLLQYHDFQINRLGISSPQVSAFLASYWNLPAHLTDELRALSQHYKSIAPHTLSSTGIACVASAVHTYLGVKNDSSIEHKDFHIILKQNFFDFKLIWTEQLESLSKRLESRVEGLRSQAKELV